jgi:hypothetical protein
MSVALTPGLAEGRYLVHWNTLDDGDGHPAGGCYVFFIGQAAADAAVRGGDPLDGGSLCPAVAEEASTGEEEEPAEDEASADGDGIPVWTLVAGVLAGIVVGGVGGRFLTARS